MLIGYAARTLFQGLTFILVARALGPDGFGTFSAGLALATLVGPFVELGAYSLVIKDIVDGATPSRAVGNSLVLVVMAVPPALVILLLLRAIMVPSLPLSLIGAVGLSVFVGQKIVSIITGIHVAEGKLWRNAALEIGGGLVSLALVGFLFLLPYRTPEVWSGMFLAQNLLLGAVALCWCAATWGIPTWSSSEARDRVLPGLNLSLASAVQSSYMDLDKIMLARLSSYQATGVYSAAFRVSSALSLPLYAFLATTYPKFFDVGRNGPRAAFKLSLRILPVTVSYGLVGLGGMWFFSPFLAKLFGSDYGDASGAMRLLAVIVLLQCVHLPIGDALTGSGLQIYRTLGHIGALVLNLLLNLWLIPKHGWGGASLASIATQFLLVVFWGWTLFYKSRKESQL